MKVPAHQKINLGENKVQIARMTLQMLKPDTNKNGHLNLIKNQERYWVRQTMKTVKIHPELIHISLPNKLFHIRFVHRKSSGLFMGLFNRIYFIILILNYT